MGRVSSEIVPSFGDSDPPCFGLEPGEVKRRIAAPEHCSDVAQMLFTATLPEE
jgi:hypothetical protein